MTPAEACAGLTPAQVDAIPRIVAWLSKSSVGAVELPAWLEEYESLKAIFGGDVKDG